MVSQEDTHSQQTGRSFMNVFNLDKENENNQFVDGGDGKIGFTLKFVKSEHEEIFLPMHMPLYTILQDNGHEF